MVQTIVLLLILAVSIAGILLLPRLKQYRRDRLTKQPFPTHWNSILEKNLPFYNQLFTDERYQLQANIQILLAEKQFIGCGGLDVTEEMKLVIAAVSSLLLLNAQGRYFSKLQSILVYPTAYTTQAKTWLSPYVVEETRVARLGESWDRGHLVLSWQQICYDMQHWQDGHNVILHEFAHQLDAEDETAQGVPRLANKAQRDTWASVMTSAYQQICQTVERGKKSPIDSYGATNPAEFFAVATETFFEKPRTLYRYRQDLYGLLETYYQIDPKSWR